MAQKLRGALNHAHACAGLGRALGRIGERNEALPLFEEGHRIDRELGGIWRSPA
jgi:hypothetical protein